MRKAPLLQKLIAQTLAQQPAKNVVLTLGELNELNPSHLQQAWGELTKGTPAEHAQLHIRLIPAEVQCMACFQKYHPTNKKILCPYCGSFGAKILTGEECHLETNETQHDET